jgi:BMFP domain-containing protein YqiC
MEDKVFNLLEKMHTDLSSRIEGLEGKISSKIEGMSKEILSIELDLVRIENKMDDNHRMAIN